MIVLRDRSPHERSDMRGMRSRMSLRSSGLLSSLGGLLRPHVLPLYAGNHVGRLHGIAPERLAKLLVEDHLDKRADPLLLRLARFSQRLRQLALGFHGHSLQTAAFGELGIAEMRVE